MNNEIYASYVTPDMDRLDIVMKKLDESIAKAQKKLAEDRIEMDGHLSKSNC